MQFADQEEFTDSPDLRYIPKQYLELWTDAAHQYRQRLTPASRDTLRQLRDLSLRLTRIQEEAGVKMMTGSDCGGGGSWVVPGVSLHQEFDLLEKAGFTPLKVLQMATCNGAEFLNKLTSLGSVKEGRQADLVLLDANPLESIQHLHRISAVVRNGRYYSLRDLQNIREQVASHVAAA